MTGLQEKVRQMYGRQAAMREKLKPVERRLKTLDEHIRQADYYTEFKGIYKQYQQKKSNKREAFYESHRRELTLYEAADRYLKGVMNGHTTMPVKTWKAEQTKLTAEKEALSREYGLLKDETREVEQIRRSVEALLREDRQDKSRSLAAEL